MVDDQVDRDQRIDLLRVAAELLHRVAHRGEVDDGGDAGEILHQHARRAILDLAVDPPLLQPVGHRLQVLAGDGLAVFEAEQVFEQHLHRKGQARNVAERGGRLLQRIISVALAPDGQRRAGVEAVLAGRDHLQSLKLGSRGLWQPLATGERSGKAAVRRMVGDARARPGFGLNGMQGATAGASPTPKCHGAVLSFLQINE